MTVDLVQAQADAVAEKYIKILEDQAAEIERLRADNTGLSKAVIDIQEERDLAQAEFRAYHKAWEEGAAWIKELEEALVDERASRVYYEDSCPFRLWNDIKLKDKFLEKAKWQLQRGGKIRPNAKQHDHTAEFFRPNESPAKSWQVTDGRVRAICWAEEMAGDCKAGDVLRAMLKAGQ